MERRLSLPASGIEPSQGARGNYQTPHQPAPTLRLQSGKDRRLVRRRASAAPLDRSGTVPGQP
jgi:hypothetical protein